MEMNWQEILFSFFGGLGIFLFSIKFMGDALQKAAGDKLRDILDRFLQQLSRVDLRIAWIGWLLSLTVWSIRSLMEIVFRGVVLWA